ncbi:MAG TPA: metal-dependent hydrolase [Candidatus Bathyarchaeia archaeon]|nr:metal-dependent hydrolase [Candidatus Bathyarchaeia archaeon]
MPSIGLHLAVTLFFLAAILKDDDLKPALLLLPFGLVSDLDSFIGVHRGTLHNLFIIFVPLFVLVACKRLKGSTIKEKYFIFASLLLASHIFLDAFYNGVFLFYPFIEKSYNPLFWFGLKETGLSVLFTWIVPGNVGELLYVITPRPSVPEIPIIASGIELVIVIFALLTFFLKYKGYFFQVFYTRNRR